MKNKSATLFLTLILLSSLLFSQTKEENLARIEATAEKLVKQQLEAYNNRDIDKFLIPFSDSVEIYSFPDKLMYKGKEKMRARYKTMFENSPDLHCVITNRTILGNTVIDSEEVTGLVPNELVKAIAIYTIENEKIQKVHFIREP